MSYLALSPNNEILVPLVQRSKQADTLGNDYAIVGSQFSTPIIILYIISTFDKDVQLSWNGIDDHIPLIAGDKITLDCKANKGVLSAVYGVYVKKIGSPTDGFIYVSGFTI